MGLLWGHELPKEATGVTFYESDSARLELNSLTCDDVKVELDVILSTNESEKF